MKTNAHLRNLVYSAVLAALTCVFTAYLFHIPTPTGYVHLGDSMIYLAACLLPTPWAMAAGGIGAAMADVLTGYPHWAIWTLVIKALMVPAFTSHSDRMLCTRNVLALIPGFLITLLGYYFAGYFVYGELGAFLATVPATIFQSGGGTIVFLVVAMAFDRGHVKQKLFA
jgi:uncharacterized repeat protein (TIGR04002 family)